MTWRQLVVTVALVAALWWLGVAVPERFAVIGPVAALLSVAVSAAYAFKRRSFLGAVALVTIGVGSTVPAGELGRIAFERRVVACEDDYAAVIDEALEKPDVALAVPTPTGLCLPMKWAKGRLLGAERVVTFGPGFPTRPWILHSNRDLPESQKTLGRCIHLLGGRWYTANPCHGEEP